jgi:hypothetical protein
MKLLEKCLLATAALLLLADGFAEVEWKILNGKAVPRIALPPSWQLVYS